MTDIDYEPLAKEVGSIYHETYEDVARAVVAALRDQGFVVVPVNHLRTLVAYAQEDKESADYSNNIAAAARIVKEAMADG